MILYINACVRDGSRTRRLAEKLIEALGEEAEQVDLSAIEFRKTDQAFLNHRDEQIAAGRFGEFALARQFASADTIVIAAPYWDLSFPAELKQYIEAINVLGITFQYTPEGMPLGLCRAKKLWYVTTAGGAYVPEEFGFGYIKALAESFYGIRDVVLVKALGLDLVGADVEGILKEAEEEIVRLTSGPGADG